MKNAYKLQHDDIVKLLKEYEKEVLSRIPYRVNLVEILGANENDHTLILSEILRYKRAGRYPFLKAFLEMALPESSTLYISQPNIDTQREYIDALIWEEGRYAVIIENKINWAKDQNQQLERYVKAAKGICGQGNVYVIYLTADGRKKANAISLTPEAKRLLGCTAKTSGRYIEMNYREHILRWLKDVVLVDCRYGEQSLMSMLTQYIDYLESRFSFTEVERKNEVCQFLKKKLKQYSPVEHEQYIRLNDLLDLCEGERERQEEVGREVLNQFLNDAWSFRELMLNDKYALDLRAACDVKLWAIQEWAELSGINKPFKYKDRDGGCVFFQFMKSGCQIKFEIGMAYDKNDVEVCFHNNDRKKIGIKKFDAMYHRFLELFSKVESENKYGIVSSVGKINSKGELMTLLNGPVKAFLDADSRWTLP